MLYIVAIIKGRECDEYKNNHDAYIRYLRCVKSIETLGKELGIATETTGLTSDQEVNIPQGRGELIINDAWEGTNDAQERTIRQERGESTATNIDNEGAEVEASMEIETETENIALNRVVQQCKNWKRRQSNFWIQNYGKNSDYFIHFHIFLSEELKHRKFKPPDCRITRGTKIQEYMLCYKCKQHLSYTEQK